MSEVETTPLCATPEPLPPNIEGVQPGGGRCYRIELVWGRWRRWYLRTFRPRYVRRMAELRHGDPDAYNTTPPGAPHPILDPRDLKYCRNRCRVGWNEHDDPFRWRKKIPLARWGLAEMILIGGPLLAATLLLALALPAPLAYSALAPGALLALVVYFFRDPPRRVPSEPGLVVSPADGKVVQIVEVEHDDFAGGPAVKIGIFLSIFNVHVNRAPTAARVIELRYSPGKFLNALNPRSAVENENLWIGLEDDAPPHRRYVVRQISGAIARRIVCELAPGESIARGHKFGMIKLGSRTELILPLADGLHIAVDVGSRVRAGSSVVARYT